MPEPHRQRARLGPHPRHRRRARPPGDRGLVRRARRHAARHADRHALRHQRHQLRPRRTSSPRPAPAAWCCSTTTSSSTAACCCGAGAGVRGAALRFEEGRQALLLRRSTALEYDNLFIFDEVGWNFEPSEICRRVRRRAAAQAAATTSRVGSATSTLLSAFFGTLPRRVRAAASRPPGSTPAGTCSRC